MATDNFIVLAGQIDERPSFTETADGRPVAEFWLKHTEQHFLVRVVGHQANSIKRYWHPGASVSLTGELTQRTYPPKNGQAQRETYILARSLSYLSPRAVMEARPA